MQSTKSFSKKSVGSIAVAALLIFGVYTIMPMTSAAYAQGAVTITTSADAHNNRFYGPALLEVMFQSSQHAADNSIGTAQVTVEAFGTSQTYQLTETSTSSGIFLLYVKVDGDASEAEYPLEPANPFSGTHEYLVVGPPNADLNYPASTHLLQTTNVAEGGTIQFSFGGVTKTITYDDTPAVLTLDRTNYGPGAKIFARIYDPDINLDPTDTNSIAEVNPGDLITGNDASGTFTFVETGTNTARFEAELTVGALASGSQGRSLTIKDFSEFEGDQVDPEKVLLVNGATQRGSSSASYVVQVVSGAIQPIANVTYANELPLIVLDSDRNLNSKTQETFNNALTVKHAPPAGGTATDDFNLREKTPNSNELVPAFGQDRIRLTFKEATSAATGTIFIRPGANVQIEYNDANPNDVTSSMTLSITNTAPTLEIDKSTVGKSSEITLTLRDRELNDDSSVVESYSVTYLATQTTSDDNGTVSFNVGGTDVDVFSLRTHLNGAPITLTGDFTVTFIETGPNTGVFTATIDLAELDAAFAGTFADGDSLNFRVTDRLHPSNQPQSSVTTTIGIEKPTMSVDGTTLPVPRDPLADDNAVGPNEVDISNLGPTVFTITIVDPARNNSTLIEEVLQPVTPPTPAGNHIHEFDNDGTANARLVMTLTPAPGTTFTNPTVVEISEAIRETGFNTGVFVGEVTVHADGNDLPAWIGAKMKIDYKGLNSAPGVTIDDANSVTVTFNARQAVLSTDTSVVVNGGDVTFTVTDADANRDPNEEDSVKIRIMWTDAGGNSRDGWLELDETGESTGIFRKTVTVGENTVGGFTFSVAPDEEIDVFYYDGTPSVPPTGNLWPAFASSTVRHERTLTSGSASGALSIGIDGSVGPSANVEVTVIDTDENTNPNTKQQLQNRVTIATDRGVVQELNLEETEANSGRFVGTLKLNPSAGTASSQSGTETTIDVLPGDVVSVRYEDEKDAQGRRSTISVEFFVISVDPEISVDQDSYGAGEQMTITLADIDADTDPDSNDILNVRVTSTSDLVGLSTVQLIETGPNTGVFEGTVALTNQFTSGSLLVRDGDTITIRYTDQFPADYKDRVEAGGQLTKDFVLTVPVGGSIIGSVSPSAPSVRDSQGNTIGQVLAGQQVVLSSTIQNNEGISGPYAAIVEVRDSSGVTVYLQWQTGTLPANGSTNVGVSWTPDAPDTYTIRVFVLSSLSNPQILSEIVTSTVNVS